MTAQRARALLLSLAVPLLAVLAVHGQDSSPTGFTLVPNLGLPAVDAGALIGEPRAAGVNSARPGGALGAAIASAARFDPGSGLTYARGKLIVKFRGGAPAALHAASLRSV